MKKKITVALLTGGISSEDYLSRRSCTTLCASLAKDRYDFYVLDWKKDGRVYRSKLNRPQEGDRKYRNILSCFGDFTGDVLFNTLHGEQENCGRIQGLLELAKIPYTGNGLCPSVLGMDKEKTKICFQHLDIPTPRSLQLPPVAEVENWQKLQIYFEEKQFRYPLILKPVKGGSSDGIRLIETETDLRAAHDFLTTRERKQPSFIEEFIQGQDLSVGLFQLGPSQPACTFPVARIDYAETFFDKNVKYEKRYTVSFPSDLVQPLVDEMKEAALAIHQCLGLEGFSRTDFILSPMGIYALEVNTHPGMSRSSIMPQMVREGGFTLKFFVERMIEYAMLGGVKLEVAGKDREAGRD